MTIGKDAPGKGEMLLQRSDEPSVQGGQQPPGTRLPELAGGAAAGANRGTSEPSDAREVDNPPAWFSEPNRMLDNPDAASDWDEFAKNGAFIDWDKRARHTNLTPMEAAQFAHQIDPFKWPDHTLNAQGLLPSALLECLRDMERLLRGKAEQWSLASLVEFLGDEAPPGMLRAVEAARKLTGPSREPEAVAVTHRLPGEVTPDSCADEALLATRDLANALDGIAGKDAKAWAALLGDAKGNAKWALPARVKVGAKRGAPAGWNPVEMAKIMIRERRATPERIARAFRDREVLSPWLEEWRREQAAQRALARDYGLD